MWYYRLTKYLFKFEDVITFLTKIKSVVKDGIAYGQIPDVHEDKILIPSKYKLRLSLYFKCIIKPIN
jgi:hypothetical protein